MILDKIFRSFVFSSNILIQNIVEVLWGGRSEGIKLKKMLSNYIQTGSQNFDLQKKVIEEVRATLLSRGAMNAPFVAKAICSFYPHDFEVRDCPVCKVKNWMFDFANSKTLPAQLYPGAMEFPFYSRETLPMIYGHCKSCGIGQIVVSPKSFWIDPNIKIEGNYGEWMESESYLAEKLTHSRVHYQRGHLDQFKSDKASVMEVSPGNGIFLKTLRDEYGWKDLLGIEPDPAAATSAQRKFHIPMINEYIYRIRHKSDLDLVVFDNSLEHHSDPEHALSVAKDCLRPGGGLFIVVPNYHSYAVEHLKNEYFNMNWGHWSYFTVQSLYKLVRNVGFEVLNAYCTFLEPSIIPIYGKDPKNVELTLSGEAIEALPMKEKVFRGEFIYMVAKKL